MSLHAEGPSWAYCDLCGYYHNDTVDCDTYGKEDDCE